MLTYCLKPNDPKVSDPCMAAKILIYRRFAGNLSPSDLLDSGRSIRYSQRSCSVNIHSVRPQRTAKLNTWRTADSQGTARVVWMSSYEKCEASSGQGNTSTCLKFWSIESGHQDEKFVFYYGAENTTCIKQCAYAIAALGGGARLRQVGSLSRGGRESINTTEDSF